MFGVFDMVSNVHSCSFMVQTLLSVKLNFHFADVRMCTMSSGDMDYLYPPLCQLNFAAWSCYRIHIPLVVTTSSVGKLYVFDSVVSTKSRTFQLLGFRLTVKV